VDDVPLHIDQVDRLVLAWQRAEQGEAGKGAVGIVAAQPHATPLPVTGSMRAADRAAGDWPAALPDPPIAVALAVTKKRLRRVNPAFVVESQASMGSLPYQEVISIRK
jgi:hypothetical protein